MKLHISIGQQTFFNNGELLLPLLKGSATSMLKDIIHDEWLDFFYEFTTETHHSGKTFHQGIKANELNDVLRERMVQHIPDVKKETYVENGALYQSRKKGFDFALYDEEYKMVLLETQVNLLESKD